MTKEELLKPRYKVIADYPKSDYKIGDVLFYNEKLSTLSYSKNLTHYDKWVRAENYPAIFKKLEWWEERSIEDMPEYVTLIKDDLIKNEFLPLYAKTGRVTLKSVFIKGFKLPDGTDGIYTGWNNTFPATKEEYENKDIK